MVEPLPRTAVKRKRALRAPTGIDTRLPTSSQRSTVFWAWAVKVPLGMTLPLASRKTSVIVPLSRVVLSVVRTRPPKTALRLRPSICAVVKPEAVRSTTCSSVVTALGPAKK